MDAEAHAVPLARAVTMPPGQPPAVDGTGDVRAVWRLLGGILTAEEEDAARVMVSGNRRFKMRSMNWLSGEVDKHVNLKDSKKVAHFIMVRDECIARGLTAVDQRKKKGEVQEMINSMDELVKAHFPAPGCPGCEPPESPRSNFSVGPDFDDVVLADLLNCALMTGPTQISDDAFTDHDCIRAPSGLYQQPIGRVVNNTRWDGTANGYVYADLTKVPENPRYKEGYKFREVLNSSGVPVVGYIRSAQQTNLDSMHVTIPNTNDPFPPAESGDAAVKIDNPAYWASRIGVNATPVSFCKPFIPEMGYSITITTKSPAGCVSEEMLHGYQAFVHHYCSKAICAFEYGERNHNLHMQCMLVCRAGPQHLEELRKVLLMYLKFFVPDDAPQPLFNSQSAVKPMVNASHTISNMIGYCAKSMGAVNIETNEPLTLWTYGISEEELKLGLKQHKVLQARKQRNGTEINKNNIFNLARDYFVRNFIGGRNSELPPLGFVVTSMIFSGKFYLASNWNAHGRSPNYVAMDAQFRTTFDGQCNWEDVYNSMFSGSGYGLSSSLSQSAFLGETNDWWLQTQGDDLREMVRQERSDKLTALRLQNKLSRVMGEQGNDDREADLEIYEALPVWAKTLYPLDTPRNVPAAGVADGADVPVAGVEVDDAPAPAFAGLAPVVQVQRAPADGADGARESENDLNFYIDRSKVPSQSVENASGPISGFLRRPFKGDGEASIASFDNTKYKSPGLTPTLQKIIERRKRPSLNAPESSRLPTQFNDTYLQRFRKPRRKTTSLIDDMAAVDDEDSDDTDASEMYEDEDEDEEDEEDDSSSNTSSGAPSVGAENASKKRLWHHPDHVTKRRRIKYSDSEEDEVESEV